MHPEDIHLCRCRFPTKKTDFQPHNFDAAWDEDLLFYHVYDSCSQSPFRKDIGILAGASSARHHHLHHHSSAARLKKGDPYKHRITQESITLHLNPHNRLPTPFISLYDDEEAAWRDAQHRLTAPEVWNPVYERWEPRGEVMIAVLGARQMSEAGVFYFSAQQLGGREMLDLRPSSALRRLIGRDGAQWFAMDWIPCSAMEGFIEPHRED